MLLRANRCPHGRAQSYDAIWEPGDDAILLPEIEHCPVCDPDAVDLPS